jgi:hypothetical protein
MHIESALSGVSEADRCPNWKQGKPCGEVKNSGGGFMSMFGLGK